MPAVITDPAGLTSTQALFTEAVHTALSQGIICTASGAGGGSETETAYSSELNLWYAVQRQNKKCWNGFGIGEPLGEKEVPIAAEINFLTEGLNRAVSEVFTEDGKDGLWVLYHDKIHGGKELFSRYFGGETVAADDSGREDMFILIGRLDDAGFTARLTAFVSKVLRIKVATKG